MGIRMHYFELGHRPARRPAHLRRVLCLAAFLLASCGPSSSPAPSVEGLWKLEKALVDGLDHTPGQACYLQLDSGGMAMLLEEGRRFAGTWQLQGGQLAVACEEETRCNGPWELIAAPERMLWKGKLFHTRTTSLSFVRADRIPAVADSLFAQLEGVWLLEEMLQGGELRRVDGYELAFLPTKDYEIRIHGALADQGKVSADEWLRQVRLGPSLGPYAVVRFGETLRLRHVGKDEVFVLKRKAP